MSVPLPTDPSFSLHSGLVPCVQQPHSLPGSKGSAGEGEGRGLGEGHWEGRARVRFGLWRVWEDGAVAEAGEDAAWGWRGGDGYEPSSGG